MPTISPVQSVDVQGAIARAATRTGVDFDYLLAQARLESGLDPSAKARTSSATGLYQFIDSTWLRTLDRHGAKHGMDWADAAIGSNGRVADRATRDHLLSLRYDADTSSLMAAELTRENAAGLQTILGREAEPAELYLAHFMGLGGAQQFLGALASNPDQSAAALMPQAARANRSIFYSGGSPRSVGEVMSLMRDKVAKAYGDTPVPGAAP
ncbi:MAG: transglycosylase SLT domain-containing protein, partial [Pseudomonadota bacterium]|nr:transglycosylase SLT domain-containing protein [Pseudomonadota bacterium]